ncbi:Colossin-B like [Actinidia chinensis var. chinensis]|uniref:Colossin-B like n=1 Tax=Actinidia chinensis var. chinensis TaxID=1590841 RepID=A0A2R6PV19_ACTCC|nr:Colossin-B like [Actinidia chinensis var. chinensis]
MLLRKAFQKTRIFFHKNLKNLKSFLFGRYQKLPVYCNNSSPNTQQLDQFYSEFSELWASNNEHTKNKNTSISTKEPMEEEDEDREMGSTREGKREEPCPVIADAGGNYVLAQKMKELEMMELTDVDHVLDIEEVLHYYSCLKCPAYLDIVDKFFMDMYSEFSLPKPSSSISGSSRRLGPLKL